MTETNIAGRPRWRGQPGRLEVHYLTATDAATGTGLWIHQEVVAPIPSGAAYAHGWIATFPSDRQPSYERFGPFPVTPQPEGAWFRAGGVEMTPIAASGRARTVEWHLEWRADARPIWTFPRWAWRRQVLPAAQVVPVPVTRVRGAIAGEAFDGSGAIAHIYGRGNAQRWAWLHADLGGGDVLEVVAATARRPGLRLLPPLPLLQLRLDGRDWPRDPLAVAPLLRARLRPDGFDVLGVVGTRRVTVHVAMPSERCVSIGYADPDGGTATCTNTERADVTIAVTDRSVRGRRRRSWRLDGSGHAEVGTRP